MQETYNGWTNYETWRINLELLDGMTASDFGVSDSEILNKDTVERFAQALEMYVGEIVEQDAKGFALDLVNSFLARVNWHEIAQHMVDEMVGEMVHYT